MLLDAVVLVLREVLEAAVLVSLLIALSLNLRLRLRWLVWALPIALLGAYLLASSLATITDALDGAGQEVVNASLQLGIYLLIVAIVCCVLLLQRSTSPTMPLYVFMTLAVSFAMIREGSEIWIYVTGFAAVTEYRTAIYAGSAIGAGIGLSVGVLLFAGLRAMPAARSYATCLAALGLIGAGMVMQATLLLTQVDLLPAGKPLWNSSALLSEQSIAGELLYAVFGYEATPSALQMGLYLGSLALVAALPFALRGHNRGSRAYA